MGYVEKDDRITNTYSISHRPWKWTKSCSIWPFGKLHPFFFM
jgi:hypothetical protein